MKGFTNRASAANCSQRFLGISKSRLIAVLALGCCLGLASRAPAVTCSAPSFTAPQDFLVGSSSASAAVADFNHDGKLDLAVSNAITSSVSILLGNGAGGFGTATDIAVGTSPVFVAAADFNNDTNIDLAVADFDGGEVWVLLGNGLGGFGTPTAYPTGTQSYFVAIGNFTNDLIPDLAVMDYANSGEVSVLIGNGNGTFAAATHFAVGVFPFGAAVGDFDGNGHDDLVVANLAADTVSVLLGNGTGGFGAPTSFPVGDGPTFSAVGDFDGDLKQDLAVTNINAGTVSVLRGGGTGSFGPPTDSTVGTQPSSVAVEDFNGDGKQDLVVANKDSQTASVLLGDGTGHFGSATNFPLGHQPAFVAAGDFNGDGKTDIVTTAFDTNVVTVLLNACGNPVHDTVVLPLRPVAVTIPLGKTSVTKTLMVKVRNADLTHTTGYPVKLVVDDSDCGPLGTVASTPDFMPAMPLAQNSVTIADGKAKTAKVLLTINSSAFTSFNRRAPHRCTLWFTSSADVGLNGDPTLSNNTLPVELSITDLNDPDQIAVHESTIASLNPVTLNILSGKTSKAMTVRPKVGNADAGESPGDVITGSAADGTCPAGTVGAVDLSALSGIQPSATVAGGMKRSGTLQVTATTARCTPNKLAPQRCIATVSASGPGGDSDGTNSTTRLVIDVVDKNDSPGSCVP